MRASKLKTLNILFLTIEGILLVPPITLEYLSTRKTGIMRYLVHLNREYGETYLSIPYLTFYKVGVTILFFVSFILLIYYYKKKMNSNLFIQLFLNIVLNAIGVFFIFSDEFHSLNAYLIFLVSLFIVLILQNTRLVFEFKSRNI